MSWLYGAKPSFSQKAPAPPELACGARKEQAPETGTSMPAGYEELPDKDVAVIGIVAPQDVGQNVIPRDVRRQLCNGPVRASLASARCKPTAVRSGVPPR